MFIKIVKPGIARNPDRILIQATSIILPTRPMPYVDVSELLMLSEPFEGDAQFDEPISTDIATAQNLAPNQLRISININSSVETKVAMVAGKEEFLTAIATLAGNWRHSKTAMAVA